MGQYTALRTAIRRNQGETIVTILKAMLPTFVLFGHKNYMREIARFLMNITAVWPEFWAQMARDNLVVDGARPGHAKPNDHLCEIFVGIIKRMLKEGRLSEATIERYSKNAVLLLQVMAAMREVLHLGKRVSRHTRKWQPEQLEKVCNYLRQQRVFVYTPGRRPPSGMKADIVEDGQAAAHKFLETFLSDKLEPLSADDIEQLPGDRQLEEEFDLDDSESD